MKIIITENQFKSLIENIIKEKEYNVFEDKYAKILLNYLIETEMEIEYGLMDIKLISIFGNGSRLYHVGDKGSRIRSYRIGIDDGSLKWSFTEKIPTEMGGYHSPSFSDVAGKYIKYNNTYIRRTV